MAEQSISATNNTVYNANVAGVTGLPTLVSLRATIGGATDASSNDTNYHGGGAHKVSSTAVVGATTANDNAAATFVFVSQKHTTIDASNNATYHMTIASEDTTAVSTGFDVMFFKTLGVQDSIDLLNSFDISGVKVIKADDDAPSAEFKKTAAAHSVIRRAIDDGNSSAKDLCGNTMSSFLGHDLNNQLLKLFGAVSTLGGTDSSANNTFNTDYGDDAHDVDGSILDSLDLFIQVDASSASVVLDASGAANGLDVSGSSWDASGATELLKEIPYDNLNLYDLSNNLTTKSLPLKTGDTIVLVFDTKTTGIQMTPTQSRGISIDANPNAGSNFSVSYTPAVRRLGLALTVTSGNALHDAFDVDGSGSGRFVSGGSVAIAETVGRNAVLGRVDV